MGSKERTVKSPKTEINGKAVKPAYSRWLFKNIVAVALTLFLLKVVMVLQPTYNWVCFTMLPENMEIVRKYPNLNYDGRMSIKLGANYMYLKNTREHTPENAVKWKRLGIKYISYSVDMGIFYEAMTDIVKTVANA